MEVNGHGQQCTCYQWFVRSCVVCVFTCFIGLTCCAYCTYLVNNASKVLRYSEKLTFHDREGFKDDYLFSLQSEDDVFLRSQQHKRLKRSDITLHINTMKESGSADNDRKGRKGRHKKRKEGKKKGRRKSKTMAAHYVLTGGLHDPGVKCPIQAGGSLSRLTQFSPAQFMQDKSNPFVESNGKFVVRTKGLYLVYAQVLFEDCREDQIMVVVQKRQGVIIQEHFCFVGVSESMAKFNNTCSLTALFFLEKDDVIAMENYYPEVHINFKSFNSTFIGAVLLK